MIQLKSILTTIGVVVLLGCMLLLIVYLTYILLPLTILIILGSIIYFISKQYYTPNSPLT